MLTQKLNGTKMTYPTLTIYGTKTLISRKIIQLTMVLCP